MKLQKPIKQFLIFAAAGFAVFLFLPKKVSPTLVVQNSKIIISLKNQADAPVVAQQYDLQNFKSLYSNATTGFLYQAESRADQLANLKSDSRINYAEKDARVQAAQLFVTPVVTPNDPFFTTDPALDDRQWYLPKTRVPEAWNYTKGSANVVVAIIDTGIHASHLDLNDGRVIGGYDVVNSKALSPAADSDDNGHGTAVAGIIGAIPNNQRGISGINWNVSLMPVKTLDANGNGDLSNISAGIIWAADHGASIINLSLGGSGFPNNATMANAIAYAYNKGVLIVAAAGNDTANQGLNLDTNPVYPVCADNGQNMVLGVAATDVNDRKADFSNFGINCVDLTAPGKKILTTAFLPSDPSNDLLIYASGTSVATPVVSGIAALIKSENPSITNSQIRDIILNTADNIDGLNQDNCLGGSCNGFLGKGRVNAQMAVQPQPLLNGTLVREQATGKIYLISGGLKQYVSPFVYSQRFPNVVVTNELNGQLGNYLPGAPVTPTIGSLLKSASDATVYYIDDGVRRPLTYLVFLSRGFSFAKVQVIPDADLAAIPLADWYWPPDGTLVLVNNDPTVYVMTDQVARPVTYFVFTQRKLSFAKVIAVTSDEFSHVPRSPDSYWLAPLDGTLVKSDIDPTVYVITTNTKHALSAAAFAAHNYKFANIKTLPQAELVVIAPGDPILQ